MKWILNETIEQFITKAHELGFEKSGEKNISYGIQLIISNGSETIPVNFYHNGKILVQGKDSISKNQIAQWINLVQARAKRDETVEIFQPNRFARYFVISEKIQEVKENILDFFRQISREKNSLAAAEFFSLELNKDSERVSITQYFSGTLLVQGKSTPLFDDVCDFLDTMLAQPFSDKAQRFLPETEFTTKSKEYLEKPSAENEALVWLQNQGLGKVIEYIPPETRQTLTSASGVRNSILITKSHLEDYSVIVMPFGKAYEGYLIHLAIDLKIVEPEDITVSAESIRIGEWIQKIKQSIPDHKRYSEIPDNLQAAWTARNKAIHADPDYRFSTLSSVSEAEQEIIKIINAMVRSHKLLIEEHIPLGIKKSSQNSKSLIPRKDSSDDLWIGTDESGKGDFFGPLVVVGVLIDKKDEEYLMSKGVKDSKVLSDSVNKSLAIIIRERCKHKIINLGAKQYYEKYKEFGNLNQLLAWAHCEAITSLSGDMGVKYAIVDQFDSDQNLMIGQLKRIGCNIPLVQRPKAESDLAVAAASIVARDTFLEMINKLSIKCGYELPRGSADPKVVEIGKEIYLTKGKRELYKLCKTNFRQFREIVGGDSQ